MVICKIEGLKTQRPGFIPAFVTHFYNEKFFSSPPQTTVNTPLPYPKGGPPPVTSSGDIVGESVLRFILLEQLKITDQELKDFVVEVALEKYGYNVFRRRALIKAVEAHIKMNGDWTLEDNGAAGGKSVGSEKIEWAISQWCKQGKLRRFDRDRWRLVPTLN